MIGREMAIRIGGQRRGEEERVRTKGWMCDGKVGLTKNYMFLGIG
jgi:hypothetical protein